MTALVWTSLDTWIVVTGALVAMACALPGNFLVLRRLSMMGDAISHAVLPGIAVGFLVSGSRANIPMFVGAAIAGVLTALFTQVVHRYGKVEENASMGVVFTTLFAFGLLLMVRAADSVDLDPGCVLYGAIEMTPLDTVTLFGAEIPRAAVSGAVLLLLNAAFLFLLYKELMVSSFDRELSSSLGIHSDLMHYLLMIDVAVTTVVAFESVGSILVIAMIIVPPATAYLFTDRLGRMIGLSAVFAGLAAFGGHLAAITLPGLAGFSDTTTAGSIAVVSGVFFLGALLVAPRYGIVSRAVYRAALSLRILQEDILGYLFRAGESEPTRETPVETSRVRRGLFAGHMAFGTATLILRKNNLVRRDSGRLALTTAGRERARVLIRDHRLWERYLHDIMRVRADHVHRTSENLEHLTDGTIRKDLEKETRHPSVDPQGKQIP